MRAGRFLIWLFCAGLLILGYSVGVRWREPAMPHATTPGEAAPAGDAAEQPPPPRSLQDDERATIDLFQRSSPSVVFITSIAYRRSVFTLNVEEIPQGSGSGFVWDDSGHVVTNFHVVQGANLAQVTLSDQSTWDAKLVGVAPEKDLAVLSIDAPTDSMRPIPLGHSSDLLVGQKVFAIGNPFGLDHSLTTGIISALGREIESPARLVIRGVIQTDAAINPGNSGGPLLDSSGTLIGVNTAIYSPSGASAGIGFAIPADTVRWVVPELIAKGRIERPSLGVDVVSAQRYLETKGALVTRVAPGSSAERAGLQGTYRDRRGRVSVGDVIVAIDETPIESEDDVFLALERRRAGERVSVTYLRGGKKGQVEIELAPAQ